MKTLEREVMPLYLLIIVNLLFYDFYIHSLVWVSVMTDHSVNSYWLADLN